jgi:hypothetical protein
MSQINRIELLYSFLKQKKGNYTEIIKYFQTQDITIGIRQLQRDFKKLPVILKPNDKLIKNRNSEKIVFFKIISKTKQNRKVNTNSEFINNSHFFELINQNKIETQLELLEKALVNNLIIKIKKLKNDITGDNYSFDKHDIHFIPIKIIKHRGSYYIGGYNTKEKLYQIFDIAQLKDIFITDISFAFEKQIHVKKFEEELSTRFGVTKNFNSVLYKIVIDFTSITGNFIKEHHWHHTQKFRKKGNIITMEINCGINRELVGWLFYWMYNCKIIEPKTLKDLYNNTIEEIVKINTNKFPFVYKNKFSPKG